MGGGVGGARHHPVDNVIVHQHGAEVGHVANGLARLFQGDTLVLANFGVLLGEMLAQFAGARVDDRGSTEIDTEFRCAGTDRGLFAEDCQVSESAPQNAAGSLQDSVVIALGQHDAPPIRASAFHELVGEHLRRGHGRDRDRQPRQQVADVDVALHQFDRGVDFGLRVRCHPSPGIRHRTGGGESIQVGGDDW